MSTYNKDIIITLLLLLKYTCRYYGLLLLFYCIIYALYYYKRDFSFSYTYELLFEFSIYSVCNSVCTFYIRAILGISRVCFKESHIRLNMGLMNIKY